MAGFHRELSTASSCINHPFVCGTRPQARDQHQRKLIMPEFEESEATNSSKENYTPSTDATKKPRTRRRSGGFKTEYKAPTSAAEIGEVDAAKALKSEKLSGGAKPDAEPTKERRAPRADKPARRAEKPEQRSEPRAEKPAPRISNAKPSTETLAAIGRVETRLNERKAERDAKRAERDKNRPAKNDRTPAGRKSAPKKKAKSGGILASILSLFGMGPKEPAKKQGGNRRPSEDRGQSGRPRGKGGNRGKGQGQNRRGGKGRPRGKGGNGQRRNDRRSQDNKS